MDSRSQDIFDALDKGGIDVYFPEGHQGECVNPYVVVKYGGSSQIGSFSSSRATYNLLCYVKNFSELETYVKTVKDIMKSLVPMIMPTHFEAPSYYDDSVKAHMISVEYRNNRQIAR